MHQPEIRPTLVGHSLECEECEEVCTTFRKCNAGSPILQLQRIEGCPTTADYTFPVDEGPEALLRLLDEVLHGRRVRAKFGD